MAGTLRSSWRTRSDSWRCAGPLCGLQDLRHCDQLHLSAPEVAYVIDDCDAEAVITSRAKAAVASEVLAGDDRPRGASVMATGDGSAAGRFRRL
ncbi:MAG: hypothetical protein R2710_24350 [Acidimicrobiales bacterium]